MDYLDGYKPNDLTSDTFLSEIPVSLMKENIKAQFEDPLENRKKDHISTFQNTYTFSKDNLSVIDDFDEKADIDGIRDEFYAFMQQMFHHYFNIGFVNFDDMSQDEQDKLIHLTYRFFLINIKKNFSNFILNYIDDHRENYEGLVDEQTDVTSLSFKKEVTDPVDIYILANMEDVIRGILHEDISVDDFFLYCDKRDEKSLETRFVESMMNKCIITGNFIEKYVDMVNFDFEVEIETKVRNKILKKYKNN